MFRSVRPFVIASWILAGSAFTPSAFAQGFAKAETYWQVEDVRAGMKGQGKTVIKGTKIETFEAEVLGVLKNTSPGRDMILCKLSGAGLEKTGVIAGMSGSPVYIQNKLLGAVAFAWQFSKEPIAGITPFVQMQAYAANYEKKDLLDKLPARKVGLSAPVDINGVRFDGATVSSDYSDGPNRLEDGMWMTPLRTPLAATGFTPRSLANLRDQLGGFGLVPMQGGGAGGNIPEEERNIPLQAGGALSVAMVTGDFDLSGVGTVTHIEGKRVYGWGHPFFGVGPVELPLMTGYVHTIMPRQTVSFKMASPLRTVGLINADVSTCIAGWLDRQPSMMPMRVVVQRDPAEPPQTFNVQVARMKSMTGALVQSVLTNSVDMEGDLPDEITALVKLRVDVEGRDAIVLEDHFSGPLVGGARAPQSLFLPVGILINQLQNNPFAGVRIQRIDCSVEVQPGRRTAEIEGVEIEADTYAPGETVKATVYLRPYKGARQQVHVELPLPADLADGSYSAQVADELNSARQELRDNPTLGLPQTLDQLFDSLRLQTKARRTNLTVRLPTHEAGVVLHGKPLPNLPASMVQILGNGKRTGTQMMSSAITSRVPTNWVIQGADTIRFTVAKNKKG
jgi:hypothetical protein